MNTVLDNLKEEAQRIRLLLEELFTHSKIRRIHHPRRGDDVIFAIVANDKWQPLSERGRQIQSKVLEEYRRFHSILQTLLREQPEDALERLKDSNEEILEVIQQDGWTYTPDARFDFDKAYAALTKQTELLNRLYGVSTDAVVFVPDTNALLYNSDLANWQFDDVPLFTVVLTPTILSELDSLKVNYRVDSVRDKSEKIIRMVKEYRRRGISSGRRLSEGVPLVKGVSNIMAIATEPDMDKSLPWLNAQNNDDRLLAGVIEVMRLHPRSPVFLVSRDINLQNKAEFANVPYIEPPVPK
jgi:hypothetical protein